MAEDFRRAEVSARYFDLIMGSDPKKWGLTTGEENGTPYLQGLPEQFFSAFRELGRSHGLPLIAKDVRTWGVAMAKDEAGLEHHGWRRSLAKRARGYRHFRYEKLIDA